MKKKQIQEIIDSNEVIIGADDQPQIDNNKVTQSKDMTDKSAKTGHQHFDDKFWGTFGFSLYENNDGSNDLRKQLAVLMFDKFKEWVNTLDNADDGIDSEFSKWKITAAKEFDELEDNESDNDYEWADKILDLIKSKNSDSMKKEKELSDDEMIEIAEDIISKRTDTSFKTKKDDTKELVSDKIKKIKDLFADLSDTEKGDLMSKLKN